MSEDCIGYSPDWAMPASGLPQPSARCIKCGATFYEMEAATHYQYCPHCGSKGTIKATEQKK